MGLATALLEPTIITDDGDSQTVTSVPYRGVLFIIHAFDVEGGDPTLDLALKVFDEAQQDYVTVASFPQITGNAKQQYLVYPGVDDAIYPVLPGKYRISWSIGGTDQPSFTMSIGANYLL